MKDYSVYLFDWDGTFVDSLQIWMDVIQDTLRELDIELPTEALIKGLGDWNDMIPYGFPADKLGIFAERCRDEAKRHLPDAPLYDNARETLLHIKATGKQTALITASHERVVSRILAQHDMHDSFNTIVFGSDVTHYKPHPEGLQLALKRLGNPPPENAVMIGDSPRDLEAAQRAGVDRVLFHPPSHSMLYDRAQLLEFQPVLVAADWVELEDNLSGIT